MVATWVWRYNLDALLDDMQNLSGERLDEGVEKVLRDDIEASDTDLSPPRWASGEFDGPNPIMARLGIDQGTEVLQVQLELPDELEARAGWGSNRRDGKDTLWNADTREHWERDNPDDLCIRCRR